MNKKTQIYLLAIGIIVALGAYFIRFNGLESSHSAGGLYTSVVCDALTDRPAHVKCVVLSELGSISGGNGRFLLIGEQKCVVPSKAYFLWLASSQGSNEPNLFYLNSELDFVSLSVSINLSQLDEIQALMKHRETLGLNARRIVELVTEQKLNIPTENES